MRRALLSLACGLALIGCGGEGQPPPPEGALPAGSVVHLLPRLEDGRGPATTLASSEVSVQEWMPLSRPEQAAPWSAPAGRLMGRADGSHGLQMRRDAADARAFGLEWRGELDTAEVDVLLVYGIFRRDGIARVMWRGVDDAGEEFPAGKLSAVHVEGSSEPQRLVLPLSTRSSWSGRVSALRLEPTQQNPRSDLLLGLGFGSQGFVPGPGMESAAHADAEGDFVTREHSAMRAWPSSLGVPLYASARAPAQARVEVHATAHVRLAGRREPLRLALDARRPGAEWRELAEGEMALSGPGARSRWVPLAAELGELADGELELRLRSWIGVDASAASGGAATPAGLDGELTRTDVYWGAPVLYVERPLERRPSILLVTLDTTRALALSSYGGQAQTPLLDELAAEGTLYERALATVNSTQPSHASILTGTWVQDHGVLNNYQVLAEGNASLAEVLREAGYMTGAAVSQQHLGLEAGFGQGFDVFIEAQEGTHLDGAQTVERSLQWLRRWSGDGSRPFFYWLHLFDPHTPYTPPEAWLASAPQSGGGAMPAPEVEPPSLPVLDVMPPALSFLEGITNEAWARWMYHSEVSYSDALLSRVRGLLERSGDWQHTGVLVTADHGEALGEHDVWYTHIGLYPEVIRVPMILRLPGRPARGRVETPVSTVDIAATLLSYAGVRAPEPQRGLDLAHLDEGAAGARRLWFQHSDDLQVGCMDERYWFITTPSHKMRFGLEVVVDEQGRRRSEVPVVPEGTSFLYDWRADPGFERNLAAEQPELVGRYLEALERWRETAQPVGSQERAMGEAERAHLADIGYGGQGD